MLGYLTLAVLLAGCTGGAEVALTVHDTSLGAAQIPWQGGTARCESGFTQVEVTVTNRREQPLSLRSDHWRLNFEGASRQPMGVDAPSHEVAPDGRLDATLQACGPAGSKPSELLLYSQDPMDGSDARLLARARL